MTKSHSKDKAQNTKILQVLNIFKAGLGFPACVSIVAVVEVMR